MSAPRHGYNAKIMIQRDEDGTPVEITGANSWSVTRQAATVETAQFGEEYTRNVAGQKNVTGNIAAWQPLDSDLLLSLPGTEALVWIYPDRGQSAYWYGKPLFTQHAGSGSTSAAITAAVDFVAGNGDEYRVLEYYGFESGGEES